MRLEYREVFVLFHEQGQPYETIADAVGRPVGTVKTWLFRARAELLKRLQERGFVPPEPVAPLEPARHDRQ
ncbi:MAG: RNA polymerase sigma factor, partial [Gemmataceae bacterium]